VPHTNFVQEGTIHHHRSEVTPLSRALLEKPIFPQAVKKFPASQGNRVLYRVNNSRHSSVSSARWIQCDYRRGIGLDIGFTDHLYTSLGTTSNYSAIANLHALQVTTAQAKPFPACCVLISRSLATTFTVEILQLPALRFSCHSLPCRTLVNSLNSQLPTISLPSLLNYLWLPIQETLNYLRRARLSTANSQLTLSWPGILVI
jgi:hypothetical protein